MLLAAGTLVVAFNSGLLLWMTRRSPAVRRFPAYGWLALAAIAGLELLLVWHAPFVTRNFTPCAWTAYIFIIDACVYRLRGNSQLHSPARFAALWLISVPAWLVFEAYNLRLANWRYTGLTSDFWPGLLTGCWAFATIYPAIFETAELAWAARFQALRASRLRPSPSACRIAVVAGGVLLLLPLLLPHTLASYLFGLVWAGFIFLLDPLNSNAGAPALLDGLVAGRPGWLVSLLFSGYVCGFYWEFWNYWASLRWEYIFPILPRLRIFAMPLPGYLGFPPFALECFTMAVFLARVLLPRNLRPRWPVLGDSPLAAHAPPASPVAILHVQPDDD